MNLDSQTLLDICERRGEFRRQSAPGVNDVMRTKIEAALKDEAFVAFADRVESELDEKFFGSNCLVELKGESNEHVQTLVWQYRQSGWKVKAVQGLDEHWYLVFHDPLAMDDA